MTKEEKEAIYEIEDIRFDERTNRKIEIILNLIDKLQKENEELKSKKQLEIDTSEEVLKWKGKYYLLSRENQELKEKIKEYEIGIVKE